MMLTLAAGGPRTARTVCHDGSHRARVEALSFLGPGTICAPSFATFQRLKGQNPITRAYVAPKRLHFTLGLGLVEVQPSCKYRLRYLVRDTRSRWARSS
jgi:hypothetical protein